MTRKTVGIPMVTRIRVIMSPRRLRSSMNRVAIMPPVGIHDPRRSRDELRRAGAGTGCGAAAVRRRNGRHSEAPSRLVTCRNHDSSEAWTSWSRYTEIPPSTRTRLISAMTSRAVPAGSVIPSPRGPTSMWAPMSRGVEQGAGSVGLGALDLDLERCSRQQLGDRSLPDDVAPVHDGSWSIGTIRGATILATSACTNCSRNRRRHTPQAVAVIRGDRQLTYRQLDERANQLRTTWRA